jgi:dTDP-4-dehydrorhamnose reductase
MKILVTGAAGQLGTELVEAFQRGGHEVVGTTHATLDISQPDQVQECVASLKPQFIVHAAAWTAVDACESDKEKAFAVNGTATASLVSAAEKVGARVAYVSTDYVFDGSKSSPYLETDTVNPQSVYGASKLAGEQALRPVDLIVRISWVCGFHGGNMVKTILRIAAAQPELTFVNDQLGHPTFADDAAAMIATLVEHEQQGIFHVTNQGAVSWHGFAQEVLRAAGQDPARVLPVLTADLQPPRPAPRPANSVLENKALAQAGFTLLDDFRIPLARLVQRLAN